VGLCGGRRRHASHRCRDALVLSKAQVVVDARDHSHDVWSVANMITMIRLGLVPVFLVVFLGSKSPNADLIACVIFVVAAATDFLDGLVARSTHTVTELGTMLDPVVDRALIVAAVVGLFLAGRLPLWIALFFVARDAYLLAGVIYLERHGARRPCVNWAGKVTTAVALVGFSLLILGWPMVPGPGLLANDPAWLPGLGSTPAYLGIYLMYLGVAFSLAAAIQYTFEARRSLAAARASSASAA
jgi:cardiolipin synthase